MLTENQIKRKSYFVKEAIKMISESGFEKLSARTVSKAAGFNTSSIYTYFVNMEHLIALACIYFTQDYADELLKKYKETDSWLEVYLLMWELFFKHSFKEPTIYFKVFCPSTREPWDNSLYKEYYQMFPEHYPPHDNPLSKFVSMENTERSYYRGKYLLTRAMDEGSIKPEAVEFILEIHRAYVYCILHDFNTSDMYELTMLYRKILKYIVLCMYFYVEDNYKSMLDNKLRLYETITL